MQELSKKDDNVLWVFLHLQKSAGTTFNGHLYKHMTPEVDFIHVGSPWLTDSQRRKITPFEKRPLEQREKARIITGHLAYYGIHSLVPGKTPRYITLIRDPAERLVTYYNGGDWGENQKVPSFFEWYKARRKNEMVNFYSSKFKGMKETARIPLSLIKLNEKFPSPEKRILWAKKLFKRFNYFKPKNKDSELQDFENAKKMLELCWFVGITELDEDIGFLFKSIGVPHKEWTRYAMTGDTKTEQINPLHKKTEKRFKLDEETRQKLYRENPLDFKLYQYALELNKKRKKELLFSKDIIKNIEQRITNLKKYSPALESKEK